MFGALLLVERALPDYQRLGDVAVLAAGLASLVVWVLRRGTIALYAGAFLTALALPGTIEALGQPLGPGWGTLFFGLAFLFVAAVRASQGGGVGWQALYGGDPRPDRRLGDRQAGRRRHRLAADPRRDRDPAPRPGDGSGLGRQPVPVGSRRGRRRRRLDRRADDLGDPLELRVGDDERRPEEDRVAVDRRSALPVPK